MQLFSGKRTANVVPGTALHVNITTPNDLRYFKGPHSLKQQKNQTHNDTGQTNKYSKQKDTIDRLYPCFCNKITLYYVRKAHRKHTHTHTVTKTIHTTNTHTVTNTHKHTPYSISPALSPSQTHSLHTC